MTERGLEAGRPTIAILANSDWYLHNFRLSFALELQRRGLAVLLLSPPGPYASRFEAMGLHWRAVPFARRSLDPVREFFAVRELAAILREERPVLLHAFTLKGVIYGAVAARWTGVPARVYAIAGLGFVFASPSRMARVLRPVVRALLRWALRDPRSRLIVQNADDASAVQRAGLVASSALRLIRGSGVDLARFAPIDRSARSPASTQVVLAARLLWDKGIGEFVAAARTLRGTHPGVRFILAGDVDEGNPSTVPAAEVAAWAREGLLEWTGHVEDMPALFARADIAVLPSYYGEGLPKSLIEAEATGLPVITTDSAGCREAITHGVEGLLVPPRDPAALAAAIAALADDPVRRRTMGAAARRRAEAEFDVRSVNARTLDVYRELLPALPLGPSDP